ncbi:hypothetical protein V2J09_007016 [Rumex salicifolius]
MSNPDQQSPKKHQLPPPANLEDVESQPPPSAGGFGVSSVLRRWRREDLMKKGSVGLRAVALFLSLLSFIIMASNKHGDWKNFDKYEEYRYVLAIAILSSIYTGWKTIVHFHQFTSAKELSVSRNSALTDFFGDQIVAYLLLSSASSAVPLTNRMREGSDNIFTDSSAAAISMSFLAFFCLGLSAIISDADQINTLSFTEKEICLAGEKRNEVPKKPFLGQLPQQQSLF